MAGSSDGRRQKASLINIDEHNVYHDAAVGAVTWPGDAFVDKRLQGRRSRLWYDGLSVSGHTAVIIAATIAGAAL